MFQKPHSEDTSYPESNKPDDKLLPKTEAKAGDNSNAGAASGFTARDNSIVNIGSTINNILSKKDCQFFRLKDIDLNNFDSPCFPTLLQIDGILNKLTTYQILLLGGTHEDKQEIAINLAVKLKRHIESQNSVPNGISIWKWNSVSDYRGILAEIRGEEEDNRTEKSIRIILLPDLKPDYIGFDIDRIKQAIPNSHCYVIADTDKPILDWTMAPQQQQNCWWDTANVSYEPKILAEAAVRRLAKAKINLDTTVESYLRQQIIQLNTVAKVKDFIQWLWNEEQLLNQDAAHRKEPLTQNAVDKALSQAQQDRSATLERWFRQLTPPRQLVVIGVTLFNNLFSNQFFVGLERVVEQTWQKRESSLRSLDYSDILLLGNYCEFVSGSYQDSSRLFTYIDTEQQATEFEFSQLKLRRPDEARVLFLVAWKTHQRHIISALKEMAQMVEDSVGRVYHTSTEWELFGDEFQSQQLRDVVGQTLSEIGLISLSATNAVQNILLSLAANDSIEVRDVAAKAIASWYPDNSKQFYETLQRLYSVAVGKYLNSPNLADSIGATVAMTVSYAALSDSPNNLSTELRNWLNELSESKSFAVRAHLGYHTLVFVIPRHFQQLKVFLKKLAEKYGGLEEDNGLANAIGWSLAQAYKEYSMEVMDLIEELFQEWKRIIPKLTKTEYIEANKLRDYKANVIAITLSEIQFSDRASSQRIFNYLLELLKGKKKKTREIALQALCKQIKENFSVISDAIQEGATKLRKNERTLVAEALTAIYLQQRKTLPMPERGDTWYTQNGDIYRIWIKNDRPLTAIEATLFSWLGNEKLPVTQQLATQAFINFAKEFDLGEASFVTEFLSQNNQIVFDKTSQENFLPEHSATVFSGLWAWLAIFPTALPEMLKNRTWQPDIIKKYQPVVSNILPQAVIQTMDNNEAVEFVVNKWGKSKTKKLLGPSNDAPELTVMAKFLIPSLWLAKNPGVVFLIFFIGISVVAWIGHSTLGIITDSINKNIDRPTRTSPERNSPPVSPPPSNSIREPNTSTPFANPFELENFPKEVCGDPKPTNPQDYPVSFYPVFIDNSDTNLNRIHAEFCKDAVPRFREKMNKTSILVASFTSTGRAEEFRAFLAKRFGNAEIGEATVVETP
jgi:hypothetical protein